MKFRAAALGVGHRSVGLLIIAASALWCVGCNDGAGASSDGPLAPDPGSGTVCAGFPAATVGIETVDPPVDITIEEVSLLDAENLRLVDAVLTPGGGKYIGVQEGYPPSPAQTPPDWSARVAAKGVAIAGGSSRNLVVGLETIDPVREGSALGVRIRYSVDGATYVHDSTLGYRVGPGVSCVPPP